MALQYSLILKRNKTYEAILQFRILQDDTTNGDAHLIIKSIKTYEAILPFLIHQDDTTMAMPIFCQTTYRLAGTFLYCNSLQQSPNVQIQALQVAQY